MKPIRTYIIAGALICACSACANGQAWDSQPVLEDTAAFADSLSDSLAQQQQYGGIPDTSHGIKKLKITKRGYKYRQQIGFAMGMMAFIVIIFTATQNWNPD